MRSIPKNIFLLVVALFLQASCSNFRPVYSSNDQLKTKLSNIEIDEIDSLNGAEFTYNLQKLLGDSEDTIYLLKISNITESTSPLAVSTHSNIIKQNLTQVYFYELIDKRDHKVIDSGKVKIIGSYDAAFAPYNAYMNEKFVKKNLAQTAAEEIYIRLMLTLGNKSQVL